MRRKETYATTGPRFKLRFFASADFDPALLEAPNLVARAYSDGVSMGSDLKLPANKSPAFIAWALRDPRSYGLRRLQIIKGWLGDDGAKREKVFDIACAGGKKPDENHRPR